jgi:AcrR family transcriptional regulator
LSEEQLQVMRDRILDAAYDILLADGPQALTSRSIAHALGIAHMTLFTYFENQAALLDALAGRASAPILARQECLERQAERDDIALVMRAALAVYPSFAAEQPALFQLAWMGPPLEGGSVERARARAQSYVAHLARLVRLGIDRGVFQDRDPDLAAAAVLGMVTFPPIAFATGRIDSAALRDALVAEMLDAAMLYLTLSSALGGRGRLLAGDGLR